MVDKELIGIWRNMLKSPISSWLLKTNYEGRGEQDKEEFERDFDEILDLALIGLKYKAQLSQERTDKRTETHACDLISRQAAVELAMKYCPDDDGAVQCDGDIRGLLDELENLPPAQPEHDAEFWRKRAEEYSNICLAMTAEMTKGIKFNSIRIDENGICFGKEQPEQKWIPCSERLPENRVSVIVCFREWQQYAKRYVYSIVVGWYARKHSVHENVFSDWEADCEYDEIEDEYYIEEGWYEFTTQGNGDLMNWYINADVIAWMPLPEPYQGGE